MLIKSSKSKKHLFFERERERAHKWGKGQRERKRRSLAGSTLSTKNDAALDLITLRS